MTNPTVFAIEPDNIDDVMWLVDHYTPTERLVSRQSLIQARKEYLEVVQQILERRGRIFASFYRPGEFWTEEVFVCPKCVHATLAEDENPPTAADDSRWYCKYCCTHWSCSAERGMFRVVVDDDDNEDIEG